MEVKDGVLVFLALLSALLFGCLTFSVMHNANQIAELQDQQQKIETEYLHLIKLANDATAGLQQSAANNHRMGKRDKQYRTVNRLRRNAEAPHDLSTSGTESPTSAVSLLTQALSEIVDKRLNDRLDRNNTEDESRCTIRPGPKGDQGELGPPGQRGEKGTWVQLVFRGRRERRGSLATQDTKERKDR